MKIRSIFISDTHLGSKFARTDTFLRFMNWADLQRPEYFYIVGDFIDGWKLKRNWYWTKECNLIIRKVFSMMKHGTKVFYTAGNHDEFLRYFLTDFHALDFAGLEIADEFVHESADGKRFLVTHGDKFDAAIRYAMNYTRWICTLGDIGYDFLIRMNSTVNWFRRRFNRPYWSLSKFIKHQFKEAGNFIGGFEQCLVSYAHDKNCNGVICGHIHTADMKKMADIEYINCGDWVESSTAIIEYEDGSFELINYNDLDQWDSLIEKTQEFEYQHA